MQNEFEKQVQQKMEELKIVPSEPVWEKVEMQIRKKKERRRLFFLLPLFLLLVAGGVWVANQNNATSVSSNKKSYKGTINQSAKSNLNKTEITGTTKTQGKITFNQAAAINQEKGNKLNKAKIVFEKSSFDRHQNYQSQKEILSIAKEEEELHQQTTAEINNQNPGRNLTHANEKSEKTNDNLKTSAIDATTKSENSNSLNNEKKEEVTSEKDQSKTNTSQSDSAKTNKSTIDSVLEPVMKKQAKAKWKYAIVANVGASGLGRLNLYNGAKSLTGQFSSSPGTSGGIIYSGPSPVQKDLAFSIGLLRQKQLEKRLAFSIGLQYNYYSNSILVGSKVEKDTTFKNLYSVSQFFTSGITLSTNGGTTYSTSFQTFKNHYHLISLPLVIDWQVLRNFPLNFHAGFSLEEIIQSNALIFDYGSQAYYHSNKAFNKTQVFTEYGLTYSVPLKKRTLSLGPQLQYALNSAERNNSEHHLFSYGLKAQLQLVKNKF